jgi:ornithine cyclodeaminase/alanine dehydrogenase-like protein (mu-crystallin family)
VLVLSQEDVQRLLDVDLLLDALERAFIELSAGRASVPPRTAAFSEHGLLGARELFALGAAHEMQSALDASGRLRPRFRRRSPRPRWP